MHYLDLDNWKRKEHFNFFKDFEEGFFGFTIKLDLSIAKSLCKNEGISLFIYYHFQAIKALNQIEEFRYRIEGDKVIIYDIIHVTTTILKEDNTFAFSFIPYHENLTEFAQMASKEIQRVKKIPGIGFDDNNARKDIIHASTIPWINFESLSHARRLKGDDSAPKLAFGKINEVDGKTEIPFSIHVHHALMDAYHVAKFIDLFQHLLNGGEVN